MLRWMCWRNRLWRPARRVGTWRHSLEGRGGARMAPRQPAGTPALRLVWALLITVRIRDGARTSSLSWYDALIRIESLNARLSIPFSKCFLRGLRRDGGGMGRICIAIE